MAWTTQAEAQASLRRLLSDGAEDKFRHRLKCFGRVDGANLIFKTPERRRVTNFSTNVDARLGVFLDNDATNQAITSDDPVKGEFTLTGAPAAGRRVVASFYYQDLTDIEIDEFLASGGQFILCVDNVIDINPGLQPAALKYAAGEAFTYLATKPESLTSTYRITDRTGKAIDVPLATHYNTMSDRMFKQAKSVREDFYTRKDQNKAPLFGTVRGKVRDRVPPR